METVCLDKEVKSFTKHTGLKVEIAEITHFIRYTC